MRPVESRLDHIVIVAATLEEGVDFCEKSLSTKLMKGGDHVRVGTHNYLLNLGNSIYLEVIAVNPRAGAIDCPRWFGMDWPEQRERAAKGPYLATFVVGTNDIVGAAENLPEIGTARDMQRGALEWQITIRDDGGLVDGGTVPPVIQWPPGVHPTQNMPASHCRLDRLEAFHPNPERLRAAWDRIGLRECGHLAIRQSDTAEAFLSARLLTPFGLVELG